MDRGIEREHGGIAGLCRLIDQYGEAIEYELIGLGLRLDWLGSELLSWRDLLVILRNLPEGSRVDRAIRGEVASWRLSDHLLAGIVDLLAVANWQRGGRKAGPRPKSVPRPGAEPRTQRFGSDPIPIKDFNAWWHAKGA